MTVKSDWLIIYNTIIADIILHRSTTKTAIDDITLQQVCIRLEPIMLKNLPIIPSCTSQNFYPLLFFIPIVPPIIPFLFFCVSDDIAMQE